MVHVVSIAQAVGGSFALFFGAVLAGAAGIGGGGINVPVLMLIFGFEFKTAVSISLCQVLANVLMQLSLNYKSAHPHDPKRLLMYWDVISVFVPAQICGASFGVLFRKGIPRSVMESIAMAVLIFAATKTMFKAVHTRKEEQKAEKAKESGSYFIDIDVKLLTVKNTSDAFQLSSDSSQYTNGMAPKPVVPWHQIASIAAMWISYTLLISSLIFFDKCSDIWWGLFVCVLVPLVVQLITATRSVSSYQKLHPESKMEGNIDWSKNFYAAPLVVIGIGFLAAILGVGGGELMGPFFVVLKFLPQVASATTPMLSFLTTLSNVIQYGIRGEIPFTYGAWTFGIGIVGGFCGRKAAILVSKSGRPSVTVFALGTILYVAAAMIAIVMIEEGVDFSNDPLCS